MGGRRRSAVGRHLVQHRTLLLLAHQSLADRRIMVLGGIKCDG